MQHDPFTRALLAGLRRDHPAAPGARWVVAVSGGADSMALLRALHELRDVLGVALVVAHLDHRLRGAAAAAAARFVADAAAALALPCVVGRADVRRRARARGESLEMAARAARHQFFRRVLREQRADALVLAHTADDQAETVILRLLRGAGGDGLGGMQPCAVVAGLPLLRPLLGLDRAQVLAYLARRGQAWLEDETNADQAIPRNRVRHALLPALARDYNPGVRAALCRTARVLADEAAYLEAATRAAWPACVGPDAALSLAALAAQPPALRRRLVRDWLLRAGVAPAAVTFALVERMAALPARGAGRRTLLAGSITFTLAGGRLAPAGAAPAAAPFSFTVPRRGRVARPELGFSVTTRAGGPVCRPARQPPGSWPAYATVAAAALGRRRLVCRSWRPGDRIALAGGRRKLQDVFVDLKVPAADRHRIPVFTCGDEVVWLPGYAVAAPYHARAGEPVVQVCVEALGEPGRPD